MQKGNTSDLFAIFGKAMKPSYNNDITEVFGKGFSDENTVAQQNDNGLTIIRHGASAHFSDMNHRDFIKVTFEKDFCETRAFRFNKKEIRVIANYLNSILEDEDGNI